MKKKVQIIILISILVIIGIVEIIMYQNANRELLTGRYDYDDGISSLEIKEDGTFYFYVHVSGNLTLEGTYKVDGKYLFLYPTDEEEIKLEIQNKKLKVVNGGRYADGLITKGMKYKWSDEEESENKTSEETNK